MGIAGAIIVLSQAVTSLQSSHSITDRIEQIKETIAVAKIEREQYFVRKTELATVMVKIDKMSENVSALKEQVSGLRRQIDKQAKDRSFLEVTSN